MPEETFQFAQELPPPPARIFCIGIGGIGVSGLAQLLRHRGYDVSGSDRGLNDAGKQELYAKLRLQGIRLYAQDGSGVTAEHPDALIISTAVEPGNPDLVAGNGIPLLHRARALAQAIAQTGTTMIAVAGSCGKTSVTGWIASALKALGQRIIMVDGGYALDCETETFPGNFYADDNPEWSVIEVDESDKSLKEFTPDYGVLLNVGNDHYEQAELRRVFADYLSKCQRGIVVLDSLAFLASAAACPIVTFGDGSSSAADVFPENYRALPEGIAFDATPFGAVQTTQAGSHSALNACAVLALLKSALSQRSNAELGRAIGAFLGIRQRFEVMGKLANGITVINDYAHNPEKISAAISACRERFGSGILCVFQPHGFTPLKFMREALLLALKQQLTSADTLLMLPVFYAGGTAAFSPTSDEVAQEMRENGLAVQALTRTEATAAIKTATQPIQAVLVMGARDASLRTWCQELLG